MVNSKSKIINEIAQNIDCGQECYYNQKTNEIVSIPSLFFEVDEDEFNEVFGEQFKKINEQEADFIKFEPLQSFESFKIMERFADRVPDVEFQIKLKNNLAKRKPFQHFKHAVDCSDYRQDWFDFKQAEIEKIVEKILKVERSDGDQH